MASNTNNNRSEAGSRVLERPNPANDQRTDGGNVQLMEARLVELYSSLRALYRSNQELAEALAADPEDSDFAQAVEENWSTMRKQRELAVELVRDLKARGTDIDMPEDICDMNVPAWREPKKQSQEQKQEEEQTHETEEGVYL